MEGCIPAAVEPAITLQIELLAVFPFIIRRAELECNGGGVNQTLIGAVCGHVEPHGYHITNRYVCALCRLLYVIVQLAL